MDIWKKCWTAGFVVLGVCVLLACTTRPSETVPGRPLARGAEAPQCVEEGEVPPESMVRALYRNYSPMNAPGLNNEPREVLRRYFDEVLTDMFIRDQECRRKVQGMCDLNVFVLTGTNSVEISDLRLCVRRTARTEVVARFLNGGRESSCTFEVKKSGGDWKVTDIDCGESLRHWAKEH